MLDPKIIELADTMIQLQFHELTEQLAHDLEMTADEMTAHGMGTSGPHVKAAHGHCARNIELRALIVWHNLQRVLSHAGVLPSETLADELKEAVSKYADAIFTEPHSRMERLVDRIGSSYRPSLKDPHERALRKVHAEIDLYVLELNRRKESQSVQSNAGLVFNAPVGAVLTGPNATANVFQTITQQDRDALLTAVDLLKKGLVSVEQLPAHPKEEIVELVEEAEIEIPKSKPNNTRLLSIFMTVAQAIQTVGSLRPAYDALRTALIPFGVQLP